MMKLVDILYEDTKVNQRYVEKLMPKLSEYYAGLYKDTDWFNAAYTMAHTQKGPYEYQAAAMNINIQLEELNKLTSGNLNLLNMDMSQVLALRDKLQYLNKSINNNFNLLVNLRDMFSSIAQGNFMDTYSVPPGVMIELWTKWLKEIYEPEAEKRRMSYGGKQLRYMDDEGGVDRRSMEWITHNPYFGQQDFWKIYHPRGEQMNYYVTSSYLEERGIDDRPLMFVAKDMEEVDEFIDNAEMEMAVDELSQYFNSVGARKVIKYLRSEPGWIYDDEDLDVNEEIGLTVKKYIDEHPEIDFNTDGDSDQTFTRIGEILNDYLHY